MLHGISHTFEARGGDYCLLGPNGCGKTTLARAMAALIDYQGQIELDGRSIRKMKRREIAGRIAVMSQVTQIYFPFTVYETVMLGRYQHMSRRVLGNPAAEDREMVERCLESVRLSDLRDRQIDELSGGQRQRVFLAQTLAQDPEIILLDEPTNHLDVRHQLELIDYLPSLDGGRNPQRHRHFPRREPRAAPDGQRAVHEGRTDRPQRRVLRRGRRGIPRGDLRDGSRRLHAFFAEGLGERPLKFSLQNL